MLDQNLIENTHMPSRARAVPRETRPGQAGGAGAARLCVSVWLICTAYGTAFLFIYYFSNYSDEPRAGPSRLGGR